MIIDFLILPQYTAVVYTGIVFWGVALNEIHCYGIRGRMQVLVVTIRSQALSLLLTFV